MKIRIGDARLRKDPGEGYVGQVQFEVEGHPRSYEITLFSKQGEEWEYGLHFADEPGSEEQIEEVEDWLDQNDEAFDRFVEAALAAENRQAE